MRHNEISHIYQTITVQVKTDVFYRVCRGGGEVDEEGVEGRGQAPHLVHLAHIASEQTKCKGAKGEDGAGS